MTPKTGILILARGVLDAAITITACYIAVDMVLKGALPEPAALDAALQSQAACNAVAERMGVYVTIPPWQAMVLTPILDPR